MKSSVSYFRSGRAELPCGLNPSTGGTLETPGTAIVRRNDSHEVMQLPVEFRDSNPGSPTCRPHWVIQKATLLPWKKVVRDGGFDGPGKKAGNADFCHRSHRKTKDPCSCPLRNTQQPAACQIFPVESSWANGGLRYDVAGGGRCTTLSTLP